MSSATLRVEGSSDVRRTLEAWARGDLIAECLRDNRRRRILRLESPGCGVLLIKHFRVASSSRALRERAKARLGRSPALREWRALRALAAAGVPVPEPLAHAILADGDQVVAMRFVPGAALEAALPTTPQRRHRLLAELGNAVQRMHATGFAHRDLHAGNILIHDGEPILLDVQRAGRAGARVRERDLAWLDYSLWRLLSRADRLRLRSAALGVARPFDGPARKRLREVGHAARQRAEEHARSRTRRSLRAGRLYAPAVHGRRRGLRVRDLAPEALERILEAHDQALARPDGRVLKNDGRSRISALGAGEQAVVVKESPPRGPARALADVLRGSAARRAWLGGHGLAARDVGAARPLAFLERRVFGIPLDSLLVMQDLRPAEPAGAARNLDASRVVEACGRLAVALHRRGVDHGDLKASHIYVRETGGTVEARLLDLDGVRFHGDLSDERRIQALAELNASLPDRFPDAARLQAFARYAAALPFSLGQRAALQQIVDRSLSRHHRWSGRACTKSS